MAKRKQRGVSRARHPRLERAKAAISQAERLIEDGRAMEAVELLEPLLVRYPRMADLHYVYGYACVQAGDFWAALDGYERARQLSRDPSFWSPLGWLYLDLEMNVHALLAFRRALKGSLEAEELEDVRAMVAQLDSRVQGTASDLGLSVSQAEEGLRYLEAAGRSLQANDFAASITASRHAIRLLGDWPPPRNNLSLALFLEGQAGEAIHTARQVLAHDPDNVQALANAIRFLAWTGQEGRAQELWPRLKRLEPEGVHERLKMAEAAAILEKDESVYELLKPLDAADEADVPSIDVRQRVQLFLAIAEANQGRHSAQRRLRALQDTLPGMRKYLADLRAGRPGPGWAKRFPYFSIAELLPWPRMEEFIRLVGQEGQLPETRFRSQVSRFVERFPQVVLVAERFLWEEQEAEHGIQMLRIIDTPTAHAALRRFGLSQAGDDGIRQQALLHLLEIGDISPGETLRFWCRGEWQEIQLRELEVTDEHSADYGPEVLQLLAQGLQNLQEGDPEGAERLFLRVLELDLTVKEAYNNLGALYGQRGDEERAKEMCEAALEIDPLYVHPRCNLALYLMGEDDLEGAREMLRPLSDLTRFHPQDLAFYSFVQAHLAIREGEYELAKDSLEVALEVWPGYEPAEELLPRLELISRFGAGFDDFFEQQRERDQAKRRRLQAALTVPDPSLRDALSLYTKEALTGMGHVVLPWGGWSSLRKAELLDEVLDGLSRLDNLRRITGQLTDEEREALRGVLGRGGHQPWQEFDARYGNDLEESRYWQWHVPQTTMGRLRHRGLLVETTVDGELLVTVPLELRPSLTSLLGHQ